jgi:hypothetical protein
MAMSLTSFRIVLYNNILSTKDAAAPHKLFLSQPSANFYLPALSNQHNLQERLSSRRRQGLKWGIVGLGRIAHDFTSA